MQIILQDIGMGKCKLKHSNELKMPGWEVLGYVTTRSNHTESNELKVGWNEKTGQIKATI